MPVTMTANDTAWVFLEELKAHANITSNTDDTELEMVLGAAHDAVEGLTGPIRWRNITQTVAARSSCVTLSYLPVLSVTTVTGGGAPAPFGVDAAAGILTGITYYGDLDVVYVAGRAVVSDGVRLATLIIAAHLWETQRGNAPSALPFDDGQSFGGAPGVGYAIPNRAADLLAPYLSLPGWA